MNELLQGLVDEDDADERGEGFLREACDVTDEWAGVSGHQQQTEERRPQPDTRPEGQVRQPVFPANKHRQPGLNANTVWRLHRPYVLWVTGQFGERLQVWRGPCYEVSKVFWVVAKQILGCSGWFLSI